MDTLDGSILVGSINGTATNGLTLVPSKDGNAIYLDGTTQYVTYGDQRDKCFADPDMCTNGVTFSLWVYVQNAIDPTQNQIVLDSGGQYESGRGYGLWRYADGRWALAIYTDVSHHEVVGFFWDTDRWLHVVFTWNPTQGLILYVNGCVLSVGWERARVTPVTLLPEMLLGKDSWPGSLRYFGHIFLDQFLVWEEVLAPEEVRQLYSQGGVV